jgi:hypothetical protein
MGWFLKVLWYLPLIIKVGKQVLDLVQEIEKLRETSQALKSAKVGDASALKEMVNKIA